MQGYDATTYGAGFADVYDEWYRDVSDVDATVADLLDLVDDGARILELGVGTGRLAVPLARAGRPRSITVVGVDASEAMLERLGAADTDGLVDQVLGDMLTDLPAGPFDLVFVAYNTLFNLTGPGDQERCFGAVRERLVPGGRFVVEAFVPHEPARSGDDVSIRTLAADRVVLAVSRYDATRQTAEGQFVELTATTETGAPGGVRLRPWSICYSTVAQLDAMAAAAGLTLEQRWEAFGRTPYVTESPRHVSVFLRT